MTGVVIEACAKCPEVPPWVMIGLGGLVYRYKVVHREKSREGPGYDITANAGCRKGLSQKPGSGNPRLATFFLNVSISRGGGLHVGASPPEFSVSQFSRNIPTWEPLK
jgi:hypothetical protein